MVIIMKKIVIGVMAIIVLIGVPFLIMSMLSKKDGAFNIPNSYKVISVDLMEKARDNEVVFTKELDTAAEISFRIQSNSQTESIVRISSDETLIGMNTKENVNPVCDITGNSYIGSRIMLQPGTYKITVTNAKAEGEIRIGYKEKEIEASEYERLMKLDGGELDNPPEGYELVYHTELSDLNCKEESVYTLKLEKSQKLGLCVYTNSSKGYVSVDFTGKSSSYYGIINSEAQRIYESGESYYGKGNYEIKLTSEDADGQVYVYIKK